MKRSKIILTSLMGILLVALMISCYLLGSSRAKRIAVDFSLEEVTTDETELRYKHIPRQYSDYICSLCDELGIDSDLAVSILMVENPEYNPEAISRPNTNGTLDLGLFQLNDYYLWTTFKSRYWFENIELNPFNYKHNIYIALHHLKYLQDKLKVEDDVIMAYNGGEGNVMNGTVKPSTKVYLAKVKNNLYLLRGEKWRVRKMKKGENVYEYLQYARWAENAKRYFYPHFLWVAFRYDHGNHYFVKFDWDMWGESFYKRHGWYPVDTETRFEIQGEDEDIGIKLIWIPVSFKLFGYV